MLCQLVAVADALCLKVGVGMPPVPNVQVPMDVLGISPKALDGITERFRERFEQEQKNLSGSP
jgi:hypothetical protein